MPRNGSGSYTLPNGPFVPSTVISSTVMNQNLSDLGTALTQSIANDGQTTPVANLPMATFRHTNVGNAVARTDYAAAGQVQDSSFMWLTTIAGTDTITASITPSPTVYTAGQTFHFVAAGTNTTTSVTLNINGIGAKNITKSGTVPLVAGELQSGMVATVVYDGTQFQLLNTRAGQLITVRSFTANATYTPTTGTRFVVVEVLGGGGGGGSNASTPSAGFSAAAAGGNAGGYAKSLLTSGFSGVSLTIGAGGAGGAAAAGGNDGTNGGNTTFGALMTGQGGNGGPKGVAVSSFPTGGTVNLVNATGISGNIVNGGGAIASFGILYSAANVSTGGGASSMFGGGGAPQTIGATSANGVNASGYGAGGGGAGSTTGFSSGSGGNGSPGIIIVHEYA